MAFFRFNRDKRGYEHFYLVEPSTNRRGKVKSRVLYWFRTPPGVRVGREPFDEGVRRALEEQNPGVVFDWRAIIEAPIPSADTEKWRERRRAERAAKHAMTSPDLDDETGGGRRRSTRTRSGSDRRRNTNGRRSRCAVNQPSVESAVDPHASVVAAAAEASDVAPAFGEAAGGNKPHHPPRTTGRGPVQTWSRLTTEPAGPASHYHRIRRVVLVAGAALTLWLAGHEIAPRVLGAVAHIQGLGPAAPIVFILIYMFAVVALIPASLLTIAGGAVFGLVRGVLFALAGATLGSMLAFLLGRHAFRRLVAERLARMPRFAAVERAVSAKGRRIVFLLRLSPLVPFNFLNYALGLTTISLGDFLLASVGMIPGTIVYAYGGKVTGEALALAGQAQVPTDASYYVVLLGGLAATVAATMVVTRTASRALRDV